MFCRQLYASTRKFQKLWMFKEKSNLKITEVSNISNAQNLNVCLNRTLFCEQNWIECSSNNINIEGSLWLDRRIDAILNDYTMECVVVVYLFVCCVCFSLKVLGRFWLIKADR